jgi:hypothetical protein
LVELIFLTGFGFKLNDIIRVEAALKLISEAAQRVVRFNMQTVPG